MPEEIIITEEVIQRIAGTIEELLLEQREAIDKTYQSFASGTKFTLGVTMDKVIGGTEIHLSYKLTYPIGPKPEPQMKEKVEKKQTITEAVL